MRVDKLPQYDIGWSFAQWWLLPTYTAKEKPSQGEVVSVGPGERDDNGNRVTLDVKKGDKILFGKWSGTEVNVNGEELLIMKESDIMGIVE